MCKVRTDSQMSVDGSIAGSTRQVLVLTVWNVEVSLGVTVLLSQTEIDNVDLVTTLANAHQKVIRLDITVDEGFGMNVLDAGDELVGKEKHGLQRELAVAKVEEILQTWSEEIENHGIVVTLGSEPTNKWDTDTSSEGLVNTSLIFELRVLGLDTLELDSNLLSRNDVGSEIDITEGSATNFSSDAVLVTNAEILYGELACCCYDDDVQVWWSRERKERYTGTRLWSSSKLTIWQHQDLEPQQHQIYRMWV